MSTIKLFEIESVDNVRRFQTQLNLGRGTADFILKDNQMFVWGGRGEFVPYNGKYKIVKDKKEMMFQEL